MIIMIIFTFAGHDFLPEYSDEFDDRFNGDKNNPYFKTLEFYKTKYSDVDRTLVV